MTTKDFIRKRDFYLPYVPYLIGSYPSASLFEVRESYNDRSNSYFTFSQRLHLDAGLNSCLVVKVTESSFRMLQLKFVTFIRSCSLSQRSALFNFYYVDSRVDFDSLNAFFGSALDSDFNIPINES